MVLCTSVTVAQGLGTWATGNYSLGNAAGDFNTCTQPGTLAGQGIVFRASYNKTIGATWQNVRFDFGILNNGIQRNFSFALNLPATSGSLTLVLQGAGSTYEAGSTVSQPTISNEVFS